MTQLLPTWTGESGSWKEWEEWEEWPTWDKRGVCRWGEFGRLNIKAVRVVKWQQLRSEPVCLEAQAPCDKLPSVRLACSRLRFQKRKEIWQTFINIIIISFFFFKKSDQMQAKPALKIYLNCSQLIKWSTVEVVRFLPNEIKLKWNFVCLFFSCEGANSQAEISSPVACDRANSSTPGAAGQQLAGTNVHVSIKPKKTKWLLSKWPFSLELFF